MSRRASALVERAGSNLPRSFVAGCMMLQGLGMLTAQSTDYQSDAYAVVLSLLSVFWWGVVFTVAGVALLARRSPLTLSLAVLVMATWAGGLVWAYWAAGEGGSRTAGLPWATIAVLTLYSAGKPNGVR